MTLTEFIILFLLGILLAHVKPLWHWWLDKLTDIDIWILKRVKDYHDWQDRKAEQEYRRRIKKGEQS